MTLPPLRARASRRSSYGDRLIYAPPTRRPWNGIAIERKLKYDRAIEPDAPLPDGIGGGKLAVAMKYRVVLIKSDEGCAVSCPALRGCHSQGATVEESLENIKEAIRDWLAVEGTAARTAQGHRD